MADRGEKTHAGTTGKRTILQLEPAKYQITLLYLGHDRIKHDPDKYRCKYELQEGEATIAAKPHKIPNVVRGKNEDLDEHALHTATPGEDADPVNPPGDKKYRVMITDNHGMRSADSGLLGRPGGDTKSKPDNYKEVDGAQKKDWMPDIQPAVPFRVVVRKFFGDKAVDLEDSHDSTEMKVVVEVKDPVEEFDQYDGKRRDFLKKFYTKYNREGDDPDPGDDNALGKPKNRWFKGIRLPSHGKPGVKAVDVLWKVEYVDPPKIDEAPAGDTGANNVEFSKLTAAPEHEEMNAKFDVITKDKDGNDLKDKNDIKVGVTDLAFCPWPAGGDNYRFLITLLDSTDKDVRDEENKENGVPAKLVDHAMGEIPGKTDESEARAYTTGRFIIWKRFHIKLVVLVNRTVRADITWSDVQKVYKTAFIDVVQPDDPGGFYNLVPTQWIAELKKIFTSAADQTELDKIAAPGAPDLETEYKKFFFPKCLTDKYVDDPPAAAPKVLFGGGGLIDQVEPLARSIITHACDNVIPKIESPNTTEGKKQKDSEGFFLFLMKRPTPGTGVLGASFGDRMFWFVNRALPTSTPAQIVRHRASVTNTLGHEMGHAQFLRHSHTSGMLGGSGGGSGETATWPGAPAPPPAGGLYLFDGMANNQLLDHDQADGYACYMAYTAPDTPIPKPCAICVQTLRFYDRVKLQQENRYMNETLSDLGPLQIVRANYSNAGAPTWTLIEPDGAGYLPNLANGAWFYLMAVGKAQTFSHYDGNNRTARLNITTIRDGRWVTAGPGAVTRVLDDSSYKVTATGTGEVTFTFTKGALSATAKMRIT